MPNPSPIFGSVGNPFRPSAPLAYGPNDAGGTNGPTPFSGSLAPETVQASPQNKPLDPQWNNNVAVYSGGLSARPKGGLYINVGSNNPFGSGNGGLGSVNYPPPTLLGSANGGNGLMQGNPTNLNVNPAPTYQPLTAQQLATMFGVPLSTMPQHAADQFNVLGQAAFGGQDINSGGTMGMFNVDKLLGLPDQIRPHGTGGVDPNYMRKANTLTQYEAALGQQLTP